MLIPDKVQGHLLKVLFCTRHLFKRAEAILIAPSMVVPRGVFKINPQCMMHIDRPMVAPFMIIFYLGRGVTAAKTSNLVPPLAAAPRYFAILVS